MIIFCDQTCPKICPSLAFTPFRKSLSLLDLQMDINGVLCGHPTVYASANGGS